jgi:RNA polymerase-binding transcription factor DksA
MSGKKLTDKELQKYRETLIGLKEQVATDIKHLSQDTLMKSQKDVSGDISGYGVHMADVASDNYERDFSLERVSDEREVLIEIDEAIRRVDEGTFGQCQMCKGVINKQRLEVLPHSRFCKKCQEKQESQT